MLQVLNGMVWIFGIVSGSVGARGCWTNNPTQVAGFMGYEIFRAFCYVAIAALDIPQLYRCEIWMDDIENASKRGWNDTVYHIALQGNYNNKLCQS